MSKRYIRDMTRYCEIRYHEDDNVGFKAWDKAFRQVSYSCGHLITKRVVGDITLPREEWESRYGKRKHLCPVCKNISTANDIKEKYPQVHKEILCRLSEARVTEKYHYFDLFVHAFTLCQYYRRIRWSFRGMLAASINAWIVLDNRCGGLMEKSVELKWVWDLYKYIEGIRMKDEYPVDPEPPGLRFFKGDCLNEAHGDDSVMEAIARSPQLIYGILGRGKAKSFDNHMAGEGFAKMLSHVEGSGLFMNYLQGIASPLALCMASGEWEDTKAWLLKTYR
jgi:hypothetical protein